MEVLATAIRKEREIKGIQIGNEVKHSLIADDMIFYIENHNDATRKLLELENIIKITGYKINTHKFLAFLYTNNEKSESEIKEVILCTSATKRIKYPAINLPKETKVLYAENSKTLMKEIKHTTNKWRDIHCWKNQYTRLESTYKVLKMTIHTTKCYLQIQCDHYQITNGILHRTRTKNFTICMDAQKNSKSQSNLDKEEWRWRNQPF